MQTLPAPPLPTESQKQIDEAMKVLYVKQECQL
jgi:hypothetical protein